MNPRSEGSSSRDHSRREQLGAVIRGVCGGVGQQAAILHSKVCRADLDCEPIRIEILRTNRPGIQINVMYMD